MPIQSAHKVFLLNITGDESERGSTHPNMKLARCFKTRAFKAIIQQTSLHTKAVAAAGLLDSLVTTASNRW